MPKFHRTPVPTPQQIMEATRFSRPPEEEVAAGEQTAQTTPSEPEAFLGETAIGAEQPEPVQ